MARAAGLALLAVAALLAACADPEARCRDGIRSEGERVNGLLGSRFYAEMKDAVDRAANYVDIARSRAAAGDFEACLDNLEKAGAAIASANRYSE